MIARLPLKQLPTLRRTRIHKLLRVGYSLSRSASLMMSAAILGTSHRMLISFVRSISSTVLRRSATNSHSFTSAVRPLIKKRWRCSCASAVAVSSLNFNFTISHCGIQSSDVHVRASLALPLLSWSPKLGGVMNRVERIEYYPVRFCLNCPRGAHKFP